MCESVCVCVCAWVSVRVFKGSWEGNYMKKQSMTAFTVLKARHGGVLNASRAPRIMSTHTCRHVYFVSTHTLTSVYGHVGVHPGYMLFVLAYLCFSVCTETAWSALRCIIIQPDSSNYLRRGCEQQTSNPLLVPGWLLRSHCKWVSFSFDIHTYLCCGQISILQSKVALKILR